MATVLSQTQSANRGLQRRAEDVQSLGVRWRLSGDAVCRVTVGRDTTLFELKVQVHRGAGTPVSEQVLFLSDGRELSTAVAMGSALAEAAREQDTHLLLVRRRVSHEILETNLGYFRPNSRHFEAVPQGEFTQVRFLANGINGNVYEYGHQQPGQKRERVAVKKLLQENLDGFLGTETDERKVHLRQSAKRAPFEEDALTELGILKYLSEQEDLLPSILRLQGIFSSRDSVWLVTELATSGELFQQVQQSGKFSPQRVQHFARQTFEAVAYLHRHSIGHRDISLENLLLEDDTVKLMDFGQAVRTVNGSGEALRYCRTVGKDLYRAPECYMPQVAEVSVVVPRDTYPGDVVVAESAPGSGGTFFCEVRLPEGIEPGVLCRAEVFGYTVPPVDIWSVAICVFVMLTGFPAWSQAIRAEERFIFALENSMAELLSKWKKSALPPTAQQLLDSILVLQPSSRPAAADCLGMAFLRVEAAAAASPAVGARCARDGRRGDRVDAGAGAEATELCGSVQ